MEYGCTLIDFDDGHSPGSTHVGTKLALYRNKSAEHFFSVFDDLLTDEWCNRAYGYSLERRRPWGAYVTSTDAMDSKLVPEQLWASGEFERALALVATRQLVYERGGNLIGKDRDIIHGTAVWCLCSDETDSVQYHIDYAELYRYETNVIYPPLYAGTCQVSPVAGEEDMIGGDFQANVKGIDHYRRFGYKGKLASPDEFDKDLKSADWVTARYRRNRGILHDGNYPHLSTPVTYLRPGIKRVILGFNCFPEDVGECCLRAPEHSDAFNRTIKLYQTMASLGVPITAHRASSGGSKYGGASGTLELGSTAQQSATQTDSSAAPAAMKKGIDVKDILKNKALAKLLVTAARRLAEVEKKEKVTGLRDAAAVGSVDSLEGSA